MAVREMSDRKGIKFDGLEEFENWVETAPQLSNPALLEKCQEKATNVWKEHYYGVYMLTYQ